jgi:hypothetical protein
MSAPAGERGAVTVEAAIALCALIAVFGVLLAGVAALFGQLGCTDAASEAARLLSRGQRQLAEDTVRSLAPVGARLTVHDIGDTIQVEVLAEPAGGLLPGVQLRGEAFAVLEPGVGADHGVG